MEKRNDDRGDATIPEGGKTMPDSEIIKEIQEIKESMKRHINLTNEMGQDLLRIDAEYTGGNKVWLTTDFFKKVVKHFCHSNYLVKCLELVFDYINRLQARNKELNKENDLLLQRVLYNDGITKMQVEIAKAEAYKEFAERLCEDRVSNDPVVIAAKCLLKELVGDK